MSLRQPVRGIDVDEAVAWLRRDEPTLVVAGSGLSRGAPTWAPGAGPFLNSILNRLYAAAEYTPIHSELLPRLSPEAACGAIAEVSGDRSVLQILSVLDPHTGRKTGSVPNVGHHALVNLSRSFGWPIMTTNFDDFLELAATELGIGCEAEDLDVSAVRHVFEGQPDTARILKVHGSAKRPQSITSTVSDFARCARAIARLQIKPDPRRALVVGYSARDVDLYPWLLRSFHEIPVLWIDPHVMRKDPLTGGLVHRVHRIDGAQFCELPWNALAEYLAAPVIAASREDRVEEAYRKSINAHLDRHLEPLLERPGLAIAALTALCASQGAHQDAVRLAERWVQVKDPRAQVQTLLWGAHSCSSIDRFWRARTFAVDARRVAAFGLMLSDVGRACLAATQAKSSNLTPTAVPTRVDLQLRLRRLAASIGVVRTAAVWSAAAGFLATRLRPGRRPSGSDRVAESTGHFRLCADYLDHLIRLHSYLDAAGRSRPWLQAPVRGIWSILRRACRRLGYTQGALDVTRYMLLSGHDFTSSMGALTAAEVMGDRGRLATTKIDLALDLLDGRHQSSVDGPDPVALLREALGQAAELGCPSLELRCHVELRRAIPGYKLDAERVTDLVDATESEVIHLARSALIELLSTG